MKTKLALALEYLNWCVHEGMDIDIEGLSDKEIIELAATIQDKADIAYDAYKERFT